jgi:hypothetical protein
MIARTVVATLLLTAAAHAEPTDGEAWTQRIRDHYRHFPSIEPVRQKSPWPDAIVLHCGAEKPRKLAVEPWGVQLRLKRPRKNLFFDWFDLTVRKLADPGTSALASYRAVAGRECHAASYAFEAILQTGPYLVTMNATCTQMKTLFPYEVADLLELVRAAGFGTPTELVYDRCGQPELSLARPEEIIAEARKQRRVYEHTLPSDRETAKAKTR